MDQLLDQARDIWEGEIDFEGQRLADLLSTALLSITGVIAFLVGFATQDIYKTMYVGLGGTALTFVAIVPPWPFFNQAPLPWLPPLKSKAASWSGPNVDLRGVGIQVDGQTVR